MPSRRTAPGHPTPASIRQRAADLGVDLGAAGARPAPVVDTSPVCATPSVRKAAADLGVDLATIHGTGVGGRIKLDDVRAAAPPGLTAPRSRPASAATAVGRRPSIVEIRPSYFSGGSKVQLDAFALNPFLDDLQQTDPENVAAARRFETNVPTLFSGGDVPLFTATGFDPQLVLRLPWVVRHTVATTNDAARVAEIFEKCGAGTVESVHYADLLWREDGSGIAGYRTRVLTWLNARHVIPVPKALTLDDWRGTTHEDQMNSWADDLTRRNSGAKKR